MNRNILISCLVIASACTTTVKQKNEMPKEDDVKTARVPDSWISTRVEEANGRLNGTSAGKKILASIDAHGGLNKWFSNGPISFRFNYQPLDGGKQRDSYQVVDQWSVRAAHEVASNRNWKYGWDGKNAWQSPDSVDIGVNPRFWSTTPYYFIGLPFVLADDGVILEELEPKEYKGVTYNLIKASYEDGTGDASGDFYVVYIHPETGLIGGLRYIVSYPGFFPNGGHSPEKFMEVLGNQTIDGITISSGYNTHWFKDDKVGEHITSIEVTEVGFMPDLSDAYFNLPANAKVQEGL